MDVELSPPESSTLNQENLAINSLHEDNDDAMTSPNSPLCSDVANISISTIIKQLAENGEVLCKSQQRDEADMNKEERIKALLEIFERSKSNFLSRFGHFLNSEQVRFFEQFQSDPIDGYEVMFYLRSISQMDSKRKKHRHLRNKRYAALKRLEKNSYFSEREMMKRNPLLYEQLVGQYLTAKEKKLRDYQSDTQNTFVGVLMNGIENEQTEVKRKQQEAEYATMKEDESDSSSSDEDVKYSEPSSSSSKKQKDPTVIKELWGEISENGPKMVCSKDKDSNRFITAQERKLLKEEFISIMYQSFLDGKDEEFDYDTVDNNEEYDNLEILTQDAEEMYFDSEEPEGTVMEDDSVKVKEESSEDELDIYMNALNQHPAVCQLSESIKKL